MFSQEGGGGGGTTVLILDPYSVTFRYTIAGNLTRLHLDGMF